MRMPRECCLTAGEHFGWLSSWLVLSVSYLAGKKNTFRLLLGLLSGHTMVAFHQETGRNASVLLFLRPFQWKSIRDNLQVTLYNFKQPTNQKPSNRKPTQCSAFGCTLCKISLVNLFSSCRHMLAFAAVKQLGLKLTHLLLFNFNLYCTLFCQNIVFQAAAASLLHITRVLGILLNTTCYFLITYQKGTWCFAVALWGRSRCLCCRTLCYSAV